MPTLMLIICSKSSSGGAAIYVKKKFDHFERVDLWILDDNFESVWIEIQNKKGKNFLCGCFYRHPNTDTSRFVEHIESKFTKINKTKYNIFVWVILILIYYSMNHTIPPMNFSIQLSHIHFYHIYYSQQELLIILPQLLITFS